MWNIWDVNICPAWCCWVFERTSQSYVITWRCAQDQGELQLTPLIGRVELNAFISTIVMGGWQWGADRMMNSRPVCRPANKNCGRFQTHHTILETSPLSLRPFQNPPKRAARWRTSGLMHREMDVELFERELERERATHRVFPGGLSTH